MVLTSWDGAMRWRGGRPWRALHWAGLWYLWISFAVAFGKRVPADPAYGFALVLLGSALLLRLAAFCAARRRKAVILAQG